MQVIRVTGSFVLHVDEAHGKDTHCLCRQSGIHCEPHVERTGCGGGAHCGRRGRPTIEDVDVGATLGCGHPMGPFELFDYLNAIHLLAHVTDHMADELGERFRLPAWVKDLVREGRTGRAAGKGFYDYD
jgi:hypothetical protein